ncbi:hypothetical protein Tco_1379002 [Tanacetum coccineum]
MVSTFNETLSLVGFIPLKNLDEEKEAVILASLWTNRRRRKLQPNTSRGCTSSYGKMKKHPLPAAYKYNTTWFFDHARSHLALPTVPIVALASVDSTGLELEPDGLHLQLLSYKGIVATLLTLYRSELTFIALGGVSITLLSKVESHLLLFQKLQKGLVVSGAIHSSWVVVEMKNENDMLKLQAYFYTAIKKWDCRSRAHSIPSLFYGQADFSSVRRHLIRRIESESLAASHSQLSRMVVKEIVSRLLEEDEKLEWWFEQDIDKEEVRFEGDEDGDEV